jgi:hypothetical protein
VHKIVLEEQRLQENSEGAMQSESERNMSHFAGVIGKVFLKGWQESGGDNGFWQQIEGFAFNPYKFSLDAASGQRKAFERAFKGNDGRGGWVDCEMHFVKRLRDAEKNLPEELRVTHKLLVRIMLVSETEEQWAERFNKLVERYDNNLEMRSTARRKMINWGVFWRYK